MTEVLTHLTAGTVAGMTGVLVDYPLDTVKTRMQVCCSNSPRSYTQCATRLFQEGGVGAFYRGLSVPFAAQGAEAAVIFSVYNTALRQFRSAEEQALCQSQSPPSIWSSSCYWKASACAGLVVSFVLTPVEMLKCNMQMESSRPQWRRRHFTVRGLAYDLYATQGIRVFYRGMTGTMTRAILGNIAYFLSYEQCKQWLTRLSQQQTVSSSHAHHHPHRHTRTKDDAGNAVPAWRSMLAGGISGCLYWSIAYPADVVKTQMQVCSKASAAGFGGTLRHLYRGGGVRSLYCGWGVTAVRAFVSSAVVFTTYERCSRALVELRPVHFTVAHEATTAK